MSASDKSDVIALSVFSSRITAICDEMGARLQRAALSPNIKDRLDYSCAVFDEQGLLCAQAAHIPVHLGSMAFAMKDLVDTQAWQDGDVLVLNDPYLGGTHLPDVTFVAPVFVSKKLVAFVANRAHHANIGADEPGSMPISSSIEQEGIVIPPSLLVRQGQLQQDVLATMCGVDTVSMAAGARGKETGDFYAQLGACQLGVARMSQWIADMEISAFQTLKLDLFEYAERLSRQHWQNIPDGHYVFEDVMDSDGMGAVNIPICVRLTVQSGAVQADFTGTAKQVSGNINCPLSVVAAAVYYVFRCLLPAYAPSCAGTFSPITIKAPVGTLLNAQRPAAVAAGNVETSSRVVDVLLGALAQAMPDRIPAASQGTMNNLAMGSKGDQHSDRWDYYETLGGGSGAGPAGDGCSGLQTHMTNTLNTPVESIETHYPLRVKRYALRPGSGGQGRHTGGQGVEREFEFLAPAQVSLLTERRQVQPWGLAGGAAGVSGENLLNGRALPAKTTLAVQAGDCLTIKTPGGGGWQLGDQTE